MLDIAPKFPTFDTTALKTGDTQMFCGDTYELEIGKGGCTGCSFSFGAHCYYPIEGEEPACNGTDLVFILKSTMNRA